MALIDPFGRTINYLRLSVTDRCNLRCTYCMPATGVEKKAHADILGYEELERIAAAAVAIGVEKIRVTGGEPLVRMGIVPFLQRLSGIPGLHRLVLTTNGLLLDEMAADLRTAGIESLNISLDSLRAETFTNITRGGDIKRVMSGIAAAEAAGFRHIKINVVVMRGVNDNEIADFAALTIERQLRVRFIEYMPTLHDKDWRQRVMPRDELLEILGRRYSLRPVAPEPLGGPAQYYRLADAAGQIGIITPVSCHFCHHCNRIRVTSTGFARSCLFADSTMDLRPMLAADDHALQAALRQVAAAKPVGHTIGDNRSRPLSVRMSGIGG